MIGHHAQSDALALKTCITGSGHDPPSIVWIHLSVDFRFCVSLVWFWSYKNDIQTQLCSENCWTSFPVASLKHLLVCFLHHRGVPRSFCCMPDFCCHSCFGIDQQQLNVDQVSPSLIRQWISPFFFSVWTAPTIFYGYIAEISGLCRSWVAQRYKSGVYTLYGSRDTADFFWCF